MTPPRRRQTSTSASTTLGSQVQSIKTLSRPRSAPSITAPRTRSMARSTKLQVYDENAHTPAAAAGLGGAKSLGSGRSLRSKGPLKESISMNVPVLGDRKMDGNGKRKAVDSQGDGGDDGKKAAKVMKVDQLAVPTKAAFNNPKSDGQRPIRNLGHRSSRDSLRSLNPSAPSTPIQSNISFTQQQPRPVPTPARDILRKEKDGDRSPSPTGSPPSKFIARPPTPPRMRERPQQQQEQPSFAPAPSLPFMTPKKTPSNTQEPMKTEGKLSKMPASLRKTPGQMLFPPMTPRELTVPKMPQSLRTQTQDKITRSGSTKGSQSQPSNLEDISRHIVPVLTMSTTPTGSPSTLSRPAPSIPLVPRGASVADAAKKTQSTLDSFFTNSFSTSTSAGHMQPSEPAANRFEGSSALSTVAPDHVPEDEERKGNLAEDPQKLARRSAEPDISVNDIHSRSCFDDDVTTLQQAFTSAGDTGPVSASQASTSDVLHQAVTSSTLRVMAPPSRIPRSAAATASSSAKIVEKAPSTIAKKPSMHSLGSLPERRPSTRPALVASSNTIRAQAPSAAPPSPVRRKPSYPSSLGSGPLARPIPRMVSNPIFPPRSLSDSSSTYSADLEHTIVNPQPRSVSAPGPRNPVASELRSSLSSSTREGLSGETSKSLAGLSEALGKLKMKRLDANSSTAPSRPHSSAATPSINVNGFRVFEERPSNLTSSTSSTTQDAGPSRISSANHRPRSSFAVHPGDLSTSSDEGVADQSIAAMLCSTTGGGCLKGVRAFVDVRTSDGEDSGKVFVEILKGLGARVQSRPSERCTHVIYKSGKSSTLAWWRKQEDPKPLIVGIKWVTECKKAGQRVEEDKFVVDVSQEDVFQKQRKSMEPKAIATIQGLAPPPNPMRPALLDIAQARQKSMKYAPKISSPLKKALMRPFEEE
ncbi:hypothetical protein IAU59_001115 [Kwoniella sp. CBS 9459]